jgi:hypothetical protein
MKVSVPHALHSQLEPLRADHSQPSHGLPRLERPPRA